LIILSSVLSFFNVILGCLVNIPGIGSILGVSVATASTIAYAIDGELHIWLILCTLAFLSMLLNSDYSRTTLSWYCVAKFEEITIALRYTIYYKVLLNSRYRL
jgi:hypothetical protein